MNKDKYLKILGLSGNPSEEEIKKAYRRLAIEHHPDNFMGEKDEVRSYHEEKMKEINDAYDSLVRNSARNSSDIDLDSYRNTIINKMNSYWKNTTVGTVDLIRVVKQLVNFYYVASFSCHTKYDIDYIYEQFLKKLEIKYDNYRKEFYKDEFIVEDEVKESINYNCNVEEFYKQLLFIRDKYSRKIKFDKRVAQEIAPYKLYATCTDRVWKLISDRYVRYAHVKARKNNYQDFEEPIRLMHEEIKNLFKTVDEINNKFKTIKQDLNNVNNSSLHEDYEKIVRCYNREDALDSIKEMLENLEKKIEAYKEEQNRLGKLQENKVIVDGLYAKILDKCNNVLKSLDPLNDSAKIKELMNVFLEILDLFLKYKDGSLELDKLLMLGEVTFSDILKDKELIAFITTNKEVNSDNLKIYLKKQEYCNLIFDEASFYVLREENGKYYIKKMMNMQNIELMISLDVLNDQYVSLEEVMETAEIQGCNALYVNSLEVKVLYKIKVGKGYHYITMYRNKISMTNANTLTDFTLDYDIRFKDKQEVIEYIEQQISKELNREPIRI